MKEKICLLILFLVAVGIMSATIAMAASSVAVSPLTFELTAKPGDVIENFLKIYNPSSDTIMKIEMTVEDIVPRGEEGFVVVEPADTETYSLARWIDVEPKNFMLQPGEEKIVQFIVNVPVNAEPGGHYGTVVAGTILSGGPEATGATIIPRVGSLVLLTVPGQMNESLTIKDFSAPKYSEKGPVSFSIKFENKGTVHVKPTGYITITNWLGQKVDDVGFPSRNVLPGAVRKFDTSLSKKWLFAGKYTATLSGSYGSSNRLLTPAVITFWVFPWKIGLVGLFVIFLFVLTRRRWLAAFRILIKGESRS